MKELETSLDLSTNPLLNDDSAGSSDSGAGVMPAVAETAAPIDPAFFAAFEKFFNDLAICPITKEIMTEPMYWPRVEQPLA